MTELNELKIKVNMFVTEKLEESEDLIKSLQEKRYLDSQQKLMLQAEKQENAYWKFIQQRLSGELVSREDIDWYKFAKNKKNSHTQHISVTKNIYWKFAPKKLAEAIKSKILGEAINEKTKN